MNNSLNCNVNYLRFNISETKQQDVLRVISICPRSVMQRH